MNDGSTMVDVTQMWQWVGMGSAALVVLFLVGFVLLWLYNRREKRRKDAIAAMRVMDQWGLSWFAGVFLDYAVGDYSGLAYRSYEVLSLLMNEKQMLEKLDVTFWKIFAYYKKDPVKLAEIQEALAGTVEDEE